MEYFAFGETFLEEHSNTETTPYLFNGKELDEETGLYYYGARYYDPRTSVWQSVDPLALYDPAKEIEHYVDGEHNGGVFNSGNLATYSYCYQNPVKYLDPNGKQTDVVAEPVVETATRELSKSYVDDTGKLVLDGIKSNPKNLLKATGFGLLLVAIQETFSSAHTPNLNSKPASMSSIWASGLDQNDVKSFGNAFRSKENRENTQGSYTISFTNGKKYHGKGPITRAVSSALTIMALIKVNIEKMDWTPAPNNRQAFKDEHTRMQTDKNDENPQGYKNPINYNIRQSPGYNYKLQDGQSVE